MTYKQPPSTSTEPGLITLAGDLGGTATSPVVESIQGNSLNLGSLGATQDGYVLTWTNSSSQWQARAPGSTIAQGVDYQFSNSSSDIGGYNKLLDVASGSQSDLSASVTSGGGKTLIKAFATTSNLPGVSVIPAGLWEFNYYGYASLTGAFTTQLVFDVYTRTTGGAETLLFSVTGGNLNVTSVSRFTVSFNVTTDTYIDDTQRLVIKVSAQTSNIVSVTAHFVFDGTANTSLVRTPIAGDAIQLGGDLSGTTTSATVVNINGASVPASGSLITSTVLQVSGSSALTYALIADANVSSSAAMAVSKLAAGTSAQVLLNNSTPTPTWTTLSGDMTVGNTGTTTVSKINGSSVPAGGSLTTGNILQVSGASALTYAAVNLAGGNNFVTGNLPITNIAPGTSAQVLMSNGTPATTWTTLSSDVTVSATGVTTVNSISGSSPISITPATLQWTAGTSSPTLKQNTAASDVATNDLTVTSQAPFASASTNKTPGNIILNVSSPVGGAANGFVKLQQGGTNVIQLGYSVGVTTASSFYGIPNVAPTNSNYGLFQNSSLTLLNTPSGGTAGISVAGTGYLIVSSSSTQFRVPIGGYTGGVAFAYVSSSIGITTGTTNLSAAQYSSPYIILTGSLSGSCTIVFPSTSGAVWYVDATACTLNGNTITLQANSNNWGTTIGTTSIYRVFYSSQAGKLFGNTLTS